MNSRPPHGDETAGSSPTVPPPPSPAPPAGDGSRGPATAGRGTGESQAAGPAAGDAGHRRTGGTPRRAGLAALPALYPAPIPQDGLEAGRVLLRDGTAATLRPARDRDRPLVAEFLGRVSDQSLMRRFFAGESREAAVESLLQVGPPDERYTLLVLVGDPDHPRIVASGTYVRDERDPDAAEVAFLVEDAYQGRGLGTLLLERLALIAARHGIRRFIAWTQPDNRRMLEVLRASGFEAEQHHRDGYVVVSLDVHPSPESVERSEMRDRIATVASLRPLFRPRGIAVVGASRDPGSIGYRILEALVMNRYQGPVYPVNPKADVVGSIPAYRSVLDIPGPVDLAVVAVPRDAVLDVVDQCGAKGVRGLVVITAGFAETGAEGRALQERLVAKVRGYGMRMVGPNCLGLINTAPDVRMNASFSPVFPPHGRVAMSSQSGALGLAILEYARDLGLGLSTFVSVGNKADVSGNDLIQYWEDDEDTDLILLYLESFGNPRRFARLARRVGRKKPILAVKAGRTAAGTKAAGSHTAALAASDTAVEALFHQAGVIRADTLEDMFDIAALLANQPLPAGPRVAVVTNAGGPGILATDALAAAGLEVPEPSPATREALRRFLPAAASLGNPIDMIASATADHYRQTLRAVLADPGFDAALVIFIPVGLADVEGVAAAVREAVAEARQAGHQKPVVACFMSALGLRQPLAVGAERIPSYRFPESAARALAKAYEYARWRRRPLGRIPAHPDLDIPRARTICREAAARGGGWLSAAEVDAVLDAFGLPRIPTRFARDEEAAVAAAAELGFPVVVKMASRTLVHKTEWDGVQLNLEDGDAVRAACRGIRSRLAAAGRAGELDGFVIQPMVPGGTELVVGVTEDPLFGPLIAFGLGGVHVEILKDVVFRITPLTDVDATEMVRSIRGYRLLEGYRGHPPADQEAIQDVLLRVSRLVEEIPEIAELDINPLKAFEPGRGCRILDARIKVEGGESNER
ncbi:GNAT family N-acetyltransferase [Thermaerobacter sp. PB12/4term]|uniref:bifunctional acetate--CoA ligase family protein/GNAT family N-acetyltransferase n=1 Tax=Thermaerobacter sp. PB12/4term TaxID=2293838 RepID=UPI000E32AF1A|nr:bifunctional GNAT family N-acetyltransferase/acetate--CoA ligase family protein [Thermaerobacter sp. PB12/4term]QIA26874.1 GNAT family N-acetyltransferase [Thermaerobacter sp. PB12/4term]